MRIGICGVSSTGKSTLARAVAKATKLPLIGEDELLKKAFEYGVQQGHKFSTTYMPEFNAEDITVFEEGFLQARYEIDSKLESYVSDATPLDAINYMLTLCSRVMEEKQLKHHLQRLEQLTKTYHIVWYLPFGVLPIENDGRRMVNPYFLLGMDFTLRGILDYYKDSLHIYDMYATELEKRIKAVLDDLPKPASKLPILGVND